MKYFKKGQTVYHSEYGKGVVTEISNSEYYPIVVEFEKCTITFTADGRQIYDGTITLSQTPIAKVANIHLEGEYVPFTFEDRELLRGKWIKWKNTNSENLINYISIDRIGIDGGYVTYEELLEKAEFVDGKPCGKLG